MPFFGDPTTEALAFRNVVDEGFCIGCGVCRYAAPDRIDLSVDDGGFIRAGVNERDGSLDLSALSRLCPMTGEGENESDIASRLFPDLPEHPQVGRVLSVAAVHVHDQGMRLRSSSGGLLTWLSADLLRRGLVDGVAHVGPAASKGSDMLFEYKISRTPEEVGANAKSHYYPVHCAEILDQIRQRQDRVVIMGIPCFIKAIRKLMETDADLRQRIRYCFGLVCGHLKSKYFAESIAWQSGIVPDQLRRFDFRYKLPNRRASDYGFQAMGHSADGEIKVTQPMRPIVGSNWGHGFFKYKACDYCDDVVAECADIAIGDAWLPKYVADYRGFNIVSFRHPQLRDLVYEGVETGDLFVEELTVDDLKQSQSSGMRHRNEGLAHRLWRRRQSGEWAPTKRVAAADIGHPRRKAIYDMREVIRDESIAAFNAARAAGDIGELEKRMRKHLIAYDALNPPPLRVRLVNRLRRLLPKSFRRSIKRFMARPLRA